MVPSPVFWMAKWSLQDQTIKYITYIRNSSQVTPDKQTRHGSIGPRFVTLNYYIMS